MTTLKTLTCLSCRQTFKVTFIVAQTHPGKCLNCLLDQYVKEANNQIEQLQAEKNLLIPELKKLNSKKRQLKLAYMKIKGNWQELANKYESLDHKMAKIIHLRDMKIGTKKIVNTKTPVNPAEEAKKKALKALDGLDPATRARVLAQLHPTS